MAKTLLRRWTFVFGMACTSLSSRLLGRKFSVLECSFGLDRVRLTQHNQLLENFRRS